jgi:protein TonB
MSALDFETPASRREQAISVLLGIVFAFVLFVLMALAQMLGDVGQKASEIDEVSMAFTPPDLIELEDEPPPPPEKDEPEVELEEPPPMLSLAQLDIALNPGTAGALVGDFAMPTINASAQSLGTEDFVDFSDLDQVPRPVAGSRLDFPNRLMRKSVSGQIVVLLKLGEDGEVLDVQLQQSDLPQFDDVVLGQVSKWRFTPPTQGGKPVRAQASLPIPIHIK